MKYNPVPRCGASLGSAQNVQSRMYSHVRGVGSQMLLFFRSELDFVIYPTNPDTFGSLPVTFKSAIELIFPFRCRPHHMNHQYRPVSSNTSCQFFTGPKS